MDISTRAGYSPMGRGSSSGARLVVLLALLSLSSTSLYAQAVRMGYFALPPHQYAEADPSRPRGASIVYFEALASRMGFGVEWVGPLPLLRLSEYLKSGTLDGALGFNKFSGLEDFLYYVDSPMFYAQPVILVRRDNPLSEVRSIEDIRGYRIGLNVSIAERYSPMIDDNRETLVLERIGGETWIEQNFRKLIAGRVDAFFNREPYSVLFVAARLGVIDLVKPLSLPDPATPMYLVFSRASVRGAELSRLASEALPGLNMDYVRLLEREIEAAGR